MWLLLLFLFTQTLSAQTIKNNKYELKLNKDHSISIHAKGVPVQVLYPKFTVMISEKKPGIDRNHQNYYLAPRTSIRWSAYEEPLDTLNRWLAEPSIVKMIGSKGEVALNNKGERIWTYKNNNGKEVHRLTGVYAQGTTNPFVVGDRVEIKASKATIKGNTISLQFEPHPYFSFSAFIMLNDGDGDVQIDHRMEVKKEAYFSVAFTGAPSIPEAAYLNTPQETAGRQFKQFNHVVSEAYLRLPRVQLSTGKWNAALVIDSAEMPYKIPTRATSRFGMMMDYNGSTYKPVSFAPIIGGNESRMKAGKVHQFRLHFSLNTGDWKTMYQYIARHFYGFKDMRDNSGPGSINQTIENAIDYMADRSGKNAAFWHAEQKYFDYWTDNSGIFKPFSPLHILSAAIITDDEQLYWNRALPQVEFALSRNNNTFAPYDVAQNGQVKKRNQELGLSYMSAPQLVSLHHLYKARTASIAQMANKKTFGAQKFTDQLAQYYLYQDKKYLKTAIELAEKSVQKMKPDTREEIFMDYLDLYEATGDKKFLDAAVESAYNITTGINLSPAVPEKNMVMDKDGKVPVHDHSNGRHLLWGFNPPQPFPYKEQTVSAWRVALTGLTSPYYRGEYWMNNHGQLMRLAGLASDDFLRDISRWGMVGRFGNYAGDNRSSYSLIAEDGNAVEKPIWELSFATVNPGHVSEFTGALIDFLMSDGFHRSKGAINFPSRSMQETSFRVKVYGDQSGRFYTDSLVQLWLPRKLLNSNNKQVDYIAGYNMDGQFYIAFLNQSFEEEKVSVQLNPDLVKLNNKAEVRTWRDNLPVEAINPSGQQLDFIIPAKGIMAFAISNAEIKASLQKKMLDPNSPVTGAKSFVSKTAPYGKVHAQIISMGKGLSNAYIYTDALPQDVISTTLKYRIAGGKWEEKVDAIFPYEFSLPFTNDDLNIEFEFEVENTDQKIESSGKILLNVGS